MGITVGGKTYQIVREQSRRISRCRLTFFRRAGNAEMVTNGAFVRDAILPLDPDSEAQLPLWQERVRLNEGFYQSLIEHPLPVRETAIRPDLEQVHGERPLRLDGVSAARPFPARRSGWPALQRQFGQGYSEMRFFRRDVLAPLRLAMAVYPEATVAIDEKRGLTLYPSPAPVPERKIAILQERLDSAHGLSNCESGGGFRILSVASPAFP